MLEEKNKRRNISLSTSDTGANNKYMKNTIRRKIHHI